MSNCCICGKKLGRFDGNQLSAFEREWSSYLVCADCSKKIQKLRSGDVQAYIARNNFIDNIADEKVKEYISKIVRVPDEKEIDAFKQEENRRIYEEQIKKENFEKQLHLLSEFNQIKITTGYNFEGYNITEYKNVISGECVLGTGFLSELFASTSDLFGMTNGTFSGKLKAAKNQALLLLRESCYEEKGNAIIGVDFDYITFQNNMIGVVANGTAVTIIPKKGNLDSL